MSITLKKNTAFNSKFTQAVDTSIISYKDVKLLQKFADEEYTNQNIQKLFFAERKHVKEIFHKFNCYTFEECLRLAIISGLISDTLGKEYRDYIFKTANRNLRTKLYYDREITKLICKMPQELNSFFRCFHDSYYNRDNKNLESDCKKILKNKTCIDFLNYTVQNFKLDEESSTRCFMNHIHRYFTSHDYLSSAKILATYFDNYKFISCLYLVYHYKDDLEPIEIKNQFTDEELKILKILCFKGDMYDAEQRYNCSGFKDKFIQNMRAETLQEALNMFLFFVSKHDGSFPEFVEQELRRKCLKIIDPLFELYDNDSKKLCTKKENRLIFESAIMSEYRKIFRDHEFKPYLNNVRRYSEDLGVDMVGLLTNKWKETPKQRLKRFYDTARALELTKSQLGL